MATNTRLRGARRAAARKAVRLAIMKQFDLKPEDMATSKPTYLGRARFHSKGEMNRYKTGIVFRAAAIATRGSSRIATGRGLK